MAFAFGMSDIFDKAVAEADPDFLAQFDDSDDDIFEDLDSPQTCKKCSAKRHFSPGNAPSVGARASPGAKKQRKEYELDELNLGGESFCDDSEPSSSSATPGSRASAQGAPSKTRDVDFDSFCKKADARAAKVKQLKPQTFKCWGCDDHAALYCKSKGSSYYGFVVTDGVFELWIKIYDPRLIKKFKVHILPRTIVCIRKPAAFQVVRNERQLHIIGEVDSSELCTRILSGRGQCCRLIPRGFISTSIDSENDNPKRCTLCAEDEARKLKSKHRIEQKDNRAATLNASLVRSFKKRSKSRKIKPQYPASIARPLHKRSFRREEPRKPAPPSKYADIAKRLA